MKNRRNVLTNAGGGGSRSTGKSRVLDPNVILNSERSERDSGSIKRCIIPVTPDRFRNGLARLAENVPTCYQHSALRSLAQFGMTPTESRAIKGLRAHGRRIAFTMAEILLSLTIIGVVAAITLPSLTGNINERTWNTQRKALYARMSQAIPLMGSVNGYATAETFVTAGLSKVLKINNICDHDHLEDCGIASKFVKLNGSTASIPTKMSELNSRIVNMSAIGEGGESYSYSQEDSDAAAFETVNGESILIFYNGKCVPALDETRVTYFQTKLCANLVYDLNGSKGPNTIGKDMGYLSIFYPTDSVIVSPYPMMRSLSAQYPQDEAGAACTNMDSEYRLPNKEEMASIFVNTFLIGDGSETVLDALYWTSSVISSTKAWYFWLESGYANSDRARTQNMSVRCIKR